MKKVNYLLQKTLFASTVLIFSSLGASAQLKPLKACAPTFTPTFNPQNCTISNVYIRSVTTSGGLTNFSNLNSGCSAGSMSYTDYTSSNMILTQEAGKNVTVEVTWNGNFNAGYPSALLKIFVDWNGDGDFSAVDEYATNPGPIPPSLPHPHIVSTTSPTKSLTFKIPGSAKQGLTRMRIIASSLPQIATPPTNVTPCNAGGRGEAEDYLVEIINPCLPPAVLSIANVDSKSADFAWSPRENAEFYEYLITPVDMIPPPNVVGFSFIDDIKLNVDTFKCDTKYYVLVRAICDTAGKTDVNWDKSPWIRESFTTHPCCYEPVVTIDQIASTTARISWAPIATAYGYEYVVSNVNTPPTTGWVKTTSTTVVLQGLSPKTNQYVFVRSRCNPTPLSSPSKGHFKTLEYTSLKDIATEDISLDVYPNPVSNQLNIDINGELSDNARLQVIDLSGKVLHSQNVANEKMVVNTEMYPAGIYIVKYSDDQQIKITRVTKQ